MTIKEDSSQYFTWGCADELTSRLKKTLYCSEENDCFDLSSISLTDVAVSTLLDTSTCTKRKLTQRYASSISRQLPISPCALMIGILYSERLRQSNPVYLERVPSSDLYVVALMVASKFLHDEGEREEIFNDEWAEAAGLAVSTVNKLERDFVDALDWNLFVSPTEFLEFCSKMETKIALKHGLQRGWFSYTDLTQFLIGAQYRKILKDILESTVKIIGGCVLIYGMSLSLLATSVAYYSTPNCQSVTTTRKPVNPSQELNTGSYSQRCITRTRKRLSTNHRNDSALADDVNERLRGNETVTFPDFGQVVGSNSVDTLKKEREDEQRDCACKHIACFELHQNLHQTKLTLPIDAPYSHLYCMHQIHPGEHCQCGMERTAFVKLTEPKSSIRHPIISLPTYPANPAVFRMVVM